MPRKKYRGLATTLALALAGCMGSFGEGPAGPGGSPGAGQNELPGVSGPPSPDTGIRRLTRTEYRNSLRDLLGDPAVAANTLDADQVYLRGIFENNAEVLSTAVPAVEKYEDVANQVVESAFRAGSATRAKILTCPPGNDMACARSLVSAFVHRAWRRPVDDAEVDTVMTAALKVKADGMEEVVKLAFRMILVSPNFLYRAEVDPGAAAGLHLVSPHELATRLSYFVWSSTPDDDLLAAAEAAGDANLSKPETLRAELERMLADKKADALMDNFAAQWLNTRLVADVSPDKKVYPTFDDSLRTAMGAETRLFFQEFLRGDRSVADMMNADFTFANSRLARHYSLQGVSGTQMQRVPAGASTHRFGLLSQASVLTVTSHADRTVPTVRGKWILVRLLCAPPGTPPPNVPPLPADPKTVGLPANATVRQRLEQHDTNPTCAACHAGIDPLGFALEHYDGIGMWQDAYKNNSVDATGRFEGQDYDGAEALSSLIKNDPRFLPCFAENVFSYALGRAPTADGDAAAIKNIGAALARKGNRIADLIALVASSNAFQKRGGSP